MTGDLQHPRFALGYLRFSEQADARGVAAHRTRLLAGLTGQVVEVGAGNGRNFRHYPPEVAGVLAIEPENILRAAATAAARSAPVPVTVVDGHADALPAADATTDAVVAALVLCSVPDLRSALAEIMRVLRPGGQLRFYEHVRSRNPLFGWAEDLVVPVWTRVAAGCHPNRNTVSAIEAAGFVVDECERFGFSPSPWMPPTAHVIGRAHKP
ncbi:MAG TPA: class I SAM-dependent methyltransferase [Micromonosporaceae bacterium]